MASLRKRHEDFIRELQAPLMSSNPLNEHDTNSRPQTSQTQINN